MKRKFLSRIKADIKKGGLQKSETLTIALTNAFLFEVVTL